MRLSENKAEQHNIEQQISELQKALKNLESQKEVLIKDESKIKVSINNNKALLSNQDFFIQCMMRNQDLFARVVRSEYGIDASVATSDIIDSLRSRVIELSQSPKVKSGSDIILEVNSEIKKKGIKQPFDCLLGFDFSVQQNRGSYRRRTSSDKYNFKLKNGKVVKMSMPNQQDYTDKYFNRWTMARVMGVGVLNSDFLAYNKDTKELFNDTINTLNPNVVIFREKSGKYHYIVAESAKDIIEIDDYNEAPRYYMGLNQYLATLVYCACLYFDDFAKYLIPEVKLYESADLNDMLKDPKKKGYTLLKNFYISEVSSGRLMCLARYGKYKLYIGSAIRNAIGGYILNKTIINKCLDLILRSIYSDADVDAFYSSIEFYGVFDEVAQGDYEIFKENFLRF